MARTMTNRDTVIETLCRLAAERAEAEGTLVTLETHLFNDLNFDSLDASEYIMNIEDEFDVSIPDEQAEKVKTIGQAVDMLMPLLR